MAQGTLSLLVLHQADASIPFRAQTSHFTLLLEQTALQHLGLLYNLSLKANIPNACISSGAFEPTLMEVTAVIIGFLNILVCSCGLH